MADHIKIRPAEGTWVVRTGGAVIGETDNALELTEGDYAPVIYFPRDDIAMAFLDRSDSVSTHPHMGEARYFTIQIKSGPLNNAAWSFESPNAGLEEIAGYVAFYTSTVAVEQV
ncbi:DUF427 domain-containing protein [Roseisalinus antarcticus]|uniref:DUF427 domain-containing protein n=1 Tax=Roseisalinus antarcticus TaxID=254357 RepID=A0A1Y5SGC7_9RHOB|nr:DUF427 domain-containing protein [Roseisalinus antarcticus]SLN40072.1 hypothetical protein ROA7023_01548 [Roseisalinus antarcticus]